MTSPFDLTERHAAKAAPRLIEADEREFAALEDSLTRTIRELTERLEAERRAPGAKGQAALERDLEIHRLTARLRALGRFGLETTLGRMVRADDPSPVYIGRFGLTAADGRQLLIDWRSPAAEPFFGATHANPMGLVSRRRYRWTRGRITDYWDEVFTADGLGDTAALDDQSAFIASLGSSRSPRMRDVLGTIQADQDAIIRAGSRGALVVDGGPGTGKTVVALHRTAYLLYSDPRLSHTRGGVLFVGPSPAYLAYVADVLPSLGEDGVQTCTILNLVEEGATAVPEADARVAALKSDASLLRAVENAVRYYERPPAKGMMIETPWADIWLDPDDWAEAFDAAEAGVSHNDARDAVWNQLIEILGDRFAEDQDHDEPGEETLWTPTDRSTPITRALQQSTELRSAFAKAWPLLDPVGVVADLWAVPAFLAACAPWLSPESRALLDRKDRTWTVEDLPFLDLARQLMGDPGAAKRRRQHEAAVAREKQQIARVIDEMVAADDGEGLAQMFRPGDLQDSLIEETGMPILNPDLLAGPFAHIVVDEAQELTDAQWQMLLIRCPSRSFTIVGDRAQARHGFTETWDERLTRIGLAEPTIASLTINYRTPAEVMAAAEPVIRAAIPDANVPVSIRESGMPVRHGARDELPSILQTWLSTHPEGIACVIGDPSFASTDRVSSLTPATAKGLEFDLVVLVDPDAFGERIEGAVDRYVSMTRATQELVILE